MFEEKPRESGVFVSLELRLHRVKTSRAFPEGLLHPFNRDRSLAAAEDREPLEHVEKLTDVSEPPMSLKSLHRGVGPDEIESFPLAQRLDQKRDVAPPLPQRTYMKGEDVQTVEEILSSAP